MFRITFTTVVTTKSSRGTDPEMAQHFVLSALNTPTADQCLDPSAEIVGDGNDTPSGCGSLFPSQILFQFGTGIGQYFLLFWIDEIGLVNLHKLRFKGNRSIQRLFESAF